jgi:hypothetical protein
MISLHTASHRDAPLFHCWPAGQQWLFVQVPALHAELLQQSSLLSPHETQVPPLRTVPPGQVVRQLVPEHP